MKLMIIAFILLASASCFSKDIFQKVYSIELPEYDGEVRFNKNGTRILLASFKGGAQLMNFSTGDVIHIFPELSDPIFSSDGTLIVNRTGCDSERGICTKVEVLDSENGKLLSVIPFDREFRSRLKISNDNSKLFIRHTDGTTGPYPEPGNDVSLYEIKTGKLVKRLKVDDFSWGNSRYSGHYVSGDNEKFLLRTAERESNGDFNHKLKIFDFNSGSLISDSSLFVSSERDVFLHVTFIRDSNRVSLFTKNILTILEIEKSKLRKICSVGFSAESEFGPSFSKDGKFIFSSLDNEHVSVRSTKDCGLVTSKIEGTSGYDVVGNLVVTRLEDRVLFSDLSTEEKISSIYEGGLAISLDQKFVVRYNTVYDLRTMEELQSLHEFTSEEAASRQREYPVYTFSPDGRYMISDGKNGERVVLKRVD